ncbi:MAG: hypothetical protein P8H62_10340 [Henriciella sp.]|nr:hypothetical protein [Henriciella sp.]
MKFFIINSFRLMVYVAYIATIVIGLALAYYNAVPQQGAWITEMQIGISGGLAQVLSFVIIAGGAWVAASVVAGLIVTILDIRDDINDRLPDARRDD